MLKYFLILLLSFAGHLNAQEELPPSQSEKTVDSILNEFKKNNPEDIEATSKQDQEKLVEAEEKYMDNFLKLDKEKEREEANKFKIYLQFFTGSILLIAVIIILRNNRKKKVRGR